MKLSKIGIPTPVTIPIDSSLQLDFFSTNGLLEIVQATLKSQESPYTHVMDALKKNGLRFPSKLESIYTDIYEQLQGQSTIGFVRSSASIEDGDQLSFAGMFESLPFRLDDISSFKKAVLGVWLSSLRQPVIDYLVTTSNNHLLVELPSCMNLIVQPALNPVASGVLFSCSSKSNPLAKVYANRGLGELLNTFNFHQCEATEHNHGFSVDSIEFSRQALVFHSNNHANGNVIPTLFGQSLAVAQVRPYTYQIRLPKHCIFTPSINNTIRTELYDTFRLILDLNNGLRDFELEWLFSNDTLYIVQMRKLTALDAESTLISGMQPVVSGELDGQIVSWQGARVCYKKKVIAVNDLSYDLISALRECGGILTVSGSPHSHAAIICRELGVPVYKISKEKFMAFSRGQYCIRNGQLINMELLHV
ncbi:hypothetical protein RB981_002711 [Vibrio cholerae]|nr:hypothetical protein [Vibrio cholerae]